MFSRLQIPTNVVCGGLMRLKVQGVHKFAIHVLFVTILEFGISLNLLQNVQHNSSTQPSMSILLSLDQAFFSLCAFVVMHIVLSIKLHTTFLIKLAS
jgi:hypothetical protein